MLSCSDPILNRGFILERRFAPDVQRANSFRRVKLVSRQRQVIRRCLSHVNLHLARRLHCVAVVQHAARTADFGNPFYGKQVTR